MMCCQTDTGVSLTQLGQKHSNHFSIRYHVFEVHYGMVLLSGRGMANAVC